MQLLDSRLLIKLLKSISPDEITPETLHYILMSEDNVVNCLMYGNNNTKQAYWPNPTLWQTHAHKLFSNYKDIYTNIDAAGSIGLKKLEYCLSYNEPPKSLTDCFIRLLDEIYVAFYNEDIKLAKSEIVRILTELEAPTEDIDHIKTIESLPRLSEFLVNRARDKGGLKKQSTTKNKKRKATDKEDNEKVQVDTNTESDKGLSIVQCTYSELKQKGLTARTISKQLIANDAALYGSDILGANAGTIEQWAAQIEAAPDNWFFFCEGTRIIGNWSITFLAPEEEVSVRKGTFAGDDFSLKSVNYPLTASDKEVVVYILNISLNSGYQTHDNWKALWNSFGKRVRQLNATGITVKGIYSALFLDDHKVMFENMGFQCLVDNIVSGQVYYLDLSNPNLANISWIIPNDEAVELNLPISFKQLSHNDILDEQQLRDIAGLIYDTDKYIYPMMFSSREQAKELLPMLFASNEDNMFNLNNIYCGMVGKRIVSLILHIRGPLVWKSDQLTELANLLDMKLPKTVDLVEKNYFTGYASTASNTTAILNCCVNSNYRMRNEIRLGTRMMQSFIEHHPERLELYVLQETNAAMRLYLRTGFKPLRKCNGFSADNRELPCYFMYKPAK